MKTDRWFFRVFQEAPDLTLSFLPEAPAADPSDRSSSESGDQPVDVVYRFSATELKELNHRLDGVLWPHSSEAGTQEHPVPIRKISVAPLQLCGAPLQLGGLLLYRRDPLLDR